jgi:hypothetical protein
LTPALGCRAGPPGYIGYAEVNFIPPVTDYECGCSSATRKNVEPCSTGHLLYVVKTVQYCRVCRGGLVLNKQIHIIVGVYRVKQIKLCF